MCRRRRHRHRRRIAAAAAAVFVVVCRVLFFSFNFSFISLNHRCNYTRCAHNALALQSSSCPLQGRSLPYCFCHFIVGVVLAR